MEKIVFINGSENRDGNTAALAKTILQGRAFRQLDLIEYPLAALGQEFPGDRFEDVYDAMKSADVIVLGSPVYWYTVSGAMKVLLDRLTEVMDEDALAEKKLLAVFQGAAPTRNMLEAGNYLFGRFAYLCKMSYLGMASNVKEARALAKELAK